MSNIPPQNLPYLPSVAEGESGAASGGDAGSAGDGGERQRRSVWLRRVIRWTVLAVLFAAPLLYLPFTQDPLFVKVVAIEAAAVIATAAWLLTILVEKRISYKRSPLNIGFLALGLVLAAATALSQSRWASFWGSDITAEKTATLLSLAVLAFVTAAVFERKDVLRACWAALSSYSLLGLFTLVSIAAARFGQLPVWLNVNPAGTVNALAYVLATGFVFSLGLALTQRTSIGRAALSAGLGRLAIAASVILFSAVALTGFRLLWAGIASVVMAVIAFNFVKSWKQGDGTAEYGLNSTAAAIASLILLSGLYFAVSSAPVTSRMYQPPLEVSPALRATLAIDAKVLREKPILGMGPANFRVAYNRFRDPALNATIFWATRFNHGFSFFATLPSTVGILGVLVFLGFALLAMISVTRALWIAPESDALRWALAASVFFAVVMWFLYTSHLVVSSFLFLALGMLAALQQDAGLVGAAATEGGGERKSWWRVTRRTILVEAPAANFVISLLAVFAAAFSLLALYSLGTQYAAEAYFLRAARVMNLYGNVDSAKVFLNRAISLNSVTDSYHQGRAQVALVVVQRLIAQAATNPAQDLSGQFRAEFSDGVNAAQRATALAPENPQNWFALGQLYESVMQFVSGADRAALEAYQRAREVDPVNPVLLFVPGRVAVAVADILGLQIAETASGEERSRLEALRNETWKKAHEALGEAIGLKPDLADAHFLVAQLYLREGNLNDAIQKVRDTALLAPQDIGVHFQLGVLYYRADRLDDAKTAFNNAVALNDNYSNARYFLGLIWDRKGDRDAALSQFVKIARLNPDNVEVKRIIANLEAGRPALSGIVPPAPAPETRKEAPIREGEEVERPLRR